MEKIYIVVAIVIAVVFVVIMLEEPPSDKDSSSNLPLSTKTPTPTPTLPTLPINQRVCGNQKVYNAEKDACECPSGLKGEACHLFEECNYRGVFDATNSTCSCYKGYAPFNNNNCSCPLVDGSEQCCYGNGAMNKDMECDCDTGWDPYTNCESRTHVEISCTDCVGYAPTGASIQALGQDAYCTCWFRNTNSGDLEVCKGQDGRDMKCVF